MPWKAWCKVEARTEFAKLARKRAISFSELCTQFSISRKTGYQWLARAASGSLNDLSRKPLHSPLRVSAEVVAAIVRTRGQFPSWGPRKIAVLLRRDLGKQTPSPRTVARVLERCGLILKRRRQRRRDPLERPRSLPVPHAPNDMWTVDFKGWWLTKAKERCEPLTVRDAYSRFLLAIDVFDRIDGRRVRETFERLFTTYGIPKAIQTDNGPPFVAAHSWHGLTQLSVWWTSLGIDHVRSRPGKPSDNGGHERMHRDMADELERFAALNLELQQEACTKWRHDWNDHRPHEALKMRVPAQVYRRSRISYAAVNATAYEYPSHFELRRVSHNGQIKLKGKTMLISTTLRHHTLGFELGEEAGTYLVWLYQRPLGRVDVTTDRPKLQSLNPTPPRRPSVRRSYAVGNTEGTKTGT